MVKIINKLMRHMRQREQLQKQQQQQQQQRGDYETTPLPPFFSLEFFPPKTDMGVENLYLRIERMTALQPVFVDITWGAGGSTKDLTLAISEYAQQYFGVEALMHLTCTNMTVEELKQVLVAARHVGIENILALRGDPPKGALTWEPVPDGCANAIDLVRLIRQEHGDYFGIAVAGFPEGHPQHTPPSSSSSSSSQQTTDVSHDHASDIVHLKEKLDAGADFVLTQFFYDPAIFLEYMKQCRAAGIDCPIIPGMMPIQSYQSFFKMTQYGKTRVPDKIWQDLAPIRDNDAAVKDYGVKLCLEMCETLLAAGVPGFHFYTLNLEQSVLGVLGGLHVADSLASRRPLPWRRPASRESTKRSIIEDVRPINWANRPKSYIKRTETWDEFPNGRWGDGRSPAFGELEDNYNRSLDAGVGGTGKEDRLAMWGDSPITPEDVYEVFAMYIEGKIPALPWCDLALQAETALVRGPIAALNRAGFLSINSQPAVNGETSEHVVFGWGGAGGRVYQKAYLEFFTSPQNLKKVAELVSKHSNLVFYAVDYSGTLETSGQKGVTALTWGVFPNKEILQPTVFSLDTFVVWSKEAFDLWTDVWAYLYDDETESSALLYDIRDSYFLVAIIDNDFIDSSLFSDFEEFIK